MAGDNHGAEAQEEPQAQEYLGREQAKEEQPQVSGVDWEKAIAERDEKIAALEQQVADAAKNAEAAETLRSEIAEFKAQGESDRIDFAKNYTGILDEVYQRAVVSNCLNSGGRMVRAGRNAKKDPHPEDRGHGTR